MSVIFTRKEGANWKKHGGRPHVALILLPKQFDQVWLLQIWHNHQQIHHQSHSHEETTSTLKSERVGVEGRGGGRRGEEGSGGERRGEEGGGGERRGEGVRRGRTEGDKLHVLYCMHENNISDLLLQTCIYTQPTDHAITLTTLCISTCARVKIM